MPKAKRKAHANIIDIKMRIWDLTIFGQEQSETLEVRLRTTCPYITGRGFIGVSEHMWRVQPSTSSSWMRLSRRCERRGPLHAAGTGANLPMAGADRRGVLLLVPRR